MIKSSRTITPASPFLTRANQVLDIEINALRRLKERLDTSFDLAVSSLLNLGLTRGKIVVTGVGKSGLVGAKIAATFTSTGSPAVSLDAVNAGHGDLGIIAKGDVVIILSYSGETEEIVRILPGIKRASAQIIAMTGNPKSQVAHHADIHLDVSVTQEACPLNLAPTSSTTCMLVMGDALAMALLESKGFRKEDFARYHPHGTLGRNLLLKVQDIMRPIERVAVCPMNQTVREALAEMTRQRCGAAIIIKSNGTLAGIYTHGDFVRGFQKHADIGNVALNQVMVKSPITVRVDKLAAEALNLFEKNKIEDLIVLDSKNKPVGLVDVQDVTQQHLI